MTMHYGRGRTPAHARPRRRRPMAERPLGQQMLAIIALFTLIWALGAVAMAVRTSGEQTINWTVPTTVSTPTPEGR